MDQEINRPEWDKQMACSQHEGILCKLLLLLSSVWEMNTIMQACRVSSVVYCTSDSTFYMLDKFTIHIFLEFCKLKEGEGTSPNFFVKLVSEMAVNQQLGPVTELSRGSRTPTAHQCPWYSQAHIGGGGQVYKCILMYICIFWLFRVVGIQYTLVYMNFKTFWNVYAAC